MLIRMIRRILHVICLHKEKKKEEIFKFDFGNQYRTILGRNMKGINCLIHVGVDTRKLLSWMLWKYDLRT